MGYTIAMSPSACVQTACVASARADIIGLIIQIMTFVLTLGAFVYGVLKVEDFLKKHNEKKLNSTFSFYTNLDALIRRLYLSISYYDDMPEDRESLKIGVPSDLLHHLWGMADDTGLAGRKLLLTGVVTDFLRFISTSPDQIPPDSDITKSTLNEWNRHKYKLIIALNDLMPNNPHKPQGFDRDSLIDKHTALVEILDYFMGKIKDRYEEYIAQANAGTI